MKPEPNRSGVPLNTSVWVRYQWSSFASQVGQPQLRPLGGMPLPVEVTRIPSADPFDRCHHREVAVLRPRAPLQPDTAYEVVEQASVFPCADAGCPDPAPEVIGSFTTGQAEDHEPPRFGGVRRWEKGSIDACDDSACCGPYKAATFSVEAEASDAGDLVGYEVSVEGQVIDLLEWPSLRGWVFCSGYAVKGPPGAPRPAGRYRFHAVDLAGNRDPNTAEVTVSPGCAGESGGGSGTNGGCSQGGTAAGSGMIALLGLVALSVLRRR